MASDMAANSRYRSSPSESFVRVQLRVPEKLSPLGAKLYAQLQVILQKRASAPDDRPNSRTIALKPRKEAEETP